MIPTGFMVFLSSLGVWGFDVDRVIKRTLLVMVPGNDTEWMMSFRGQRLATQLFSVITGYNDIFYGPTSVGCHDRAAVWLKLSVATHACIAFLNLMNCTMQKRPTRFRAPAGFALCRRFQHPSTVSTMHRYWPPPSAEVSYWKLTPQSTESRTFLVYNNYHIIPVKLYSSPPSSWYVHVQNPLKLPTNPNGLVPLTARPHCYRDFLPLWTGKKKTFFTIHD